MDPLTLAITVVGILGPFVSKGAEEFAKVAGKAACEQVATMFAKLKRRWSGDPEAIDTLNRFEEKPERYGSVLKEILQEKLAADKELARELKADVQSLAPQLHIIQKIEVAQNVTGLESDKMTEGTASITQEMTEATDVTGAKINQFGK